MEKKNEYFKKIVNFEVTGTTKIIFGQSGRGKSYSPFFIKHDLLGKTDEEIKFRLQEIIADENLQEAEKEQAKRILKNLESN